MEIPIYYDPMIAKLVTHGKDRTDAIQKMIAAIKEYKIEGVTTTLPFGTFVMEHTAFVSGNFDTNFVARYYTADKIKEKQQANAEVAALVALKYYLKKQKVVKVVENKSTSWKRSRASLRPSNRPRWSYRIRGLAA